MGRKKKGKGATREWWRSLVDEDPITLEPLCELEMAPFELGRRYFDAKSLAAYLLESGRLENPCSRRALSRAECVSLDEHLRTWTGDGSRAVEKLFVLSECVVVRRKGTTSTSEAVLRREAGASTWVGNVGVHYHFIFVS